MGKESVKKKPYSEIDMTEIPAVVTYPRSGTHWINGIMQVYLNGIYLPYDGTRPNVTSEDPLVIEWGLPSPSAPTEVLWYVTHDFDLKYDCVHPYGVIFLFRNPIDSLYSNSSKLTKMNNNATDNLCSKFKALINKWVLSGKAKTVISYEEMEKTPMETMKKISKHFQKPFDQTRAEFAVRAMEKNLINSKPVPKVGKHQPAFGPVLLTNEYQNARVEYHKKHSDEIRNKIITPENRAVLIEHIPSFFEDQY